MGLPNEQAIERKLQHALCDESSIYLSFSFSSCFVRLQSWSVSSCCVTSSAQRQFTSSRSCSGALQEAWLELEQELSSRRQKRSIIDLTHFTESALWEKFIGKKSRSSTSYFRQKKETTKSKAMSEVNMGKPRTISTFLDRLLDNAGQIILFLSASSL